MTTQTQVPPGSRRAGAPAAAAGHARRWRSRRSRGGCRPMPAPRWPNTSIKPAIDSVQQDRRRRDADRALLRRPAGAHGRAVPGDAERHHRRGAVRRRLAWPRPREVRSSAAIFPSPAATASTCRCCSTSTGWMRSGRRNTPRSASSTSRAGAWDPCHFATKEPINALADLKGKRVFTFPTAGRFLAQFGVVPVTLPVGRCRGRDADRRTRRHCLVRHHRGLHRRLGGCHQLLPDQQHLGRVDRVISSPTWTAGTSCPTDLQS